MSTSPPKSRRTYEQCIRSVYPPANCEQHGDKYLDIYCFDCKCVVCFMCCVTLHSGHKCADVSEVAQTFRTEMAEDTDKLTHSVGLLEEKLEKLDNVKKCLVNNIQNVESEICQKADELKATVECHKQQLLDEVAQIKTNRMKEIENLSAEISHCKSLVESFKTYCDELAKKGSPSDIAREANKLHGKAAEMVKLNEKHLLASDDSVKVHLQSLSNLWTDVKNVVGEIVRNDAVKNPGIRLCHF